MKPLSLLVLVFLGGNVFGQYRLVTEDIDRFWKAYGNGDTTGLATRLEKQYIKPGTKALRDFQRLKFKNVNTIVRVIKRRPKYFSQLKSQTDLIETQKPEIDSAFAKMLKLYPKGKIPNVYFLIGAMEIGGVTFGNGLLIGAEMFGRTPETDTLELSPWLRNSLSGVEEVPAIVSHELIHELQVGKAKDLLSTCLHEGSADFLGEMICGKQINSKVHAWAQGKEKEIWQEFKQEMFSKNLSNWLYSGNSVKGKPADLGYWIGYQIAKSYYDQATDKKQAVYDILHVKDARKFLEKSGVEGKW